LLNIIYLWYPYILENRQHILVQTSLVICHRLSFRANKFIGSLHYVRYGFLVRKA
jgi:hypothetical protein